MLFDTHCHLNFKDFKEDRDDVIARVREQGASMIVVGSQSTTSERAVELAKRHDSVYAAVGLHPVHLVKQNYNDGEATFVSRAEEFDYGYYKEIASQEKVVAIGEMGIDYYGLEANLREQPAQKESVENIKIKQRETFVQGLTLAKELGKPMIVHTRSSRGTQDAYEAVIDILHEVGYYQCVVHCFLGSKEIADKFLKMGCLLSFTGIITFKNVRDIQEVVKHIPMNRMMIETDAPYLAPEPFRGKRNEPSYVRYVAQKIADLKGITLDEVSKVTTENAKKFFNIK